MENNAYYKLNVIAILSSLVNPIPAHADSSASLTKGAPNWYFLGGIGSSHPGWGDTVEKVETTDLILRRETTDGTTRGSGWYLNKQSMMIEIPIHILREPDEPPMFGISFQACWTFTANETTQPYVFVGGGPVYTQADIPGTSSEVRGSYGGGVGLKINSGPMQYLLEYRYHHLSNGGIKEPNDPLNSDKFLVGVKLPF